METQKDQELWKIAKKRVGFKRHLASYLIVNAFLWFLWWFTDGSSHGSFPWPVWPMLGWGIGLAFSYRDAYVHSGSSAIDKEYEKLKNKHG